MDHLLQNLFHDYHLHQTLVQSTLVRHVNSASPFYSWIIWKLKYLCYTLFVNFLTLRKVGNWRKNRTWTVHDTSEKFSSLIRRSQKSPFSHHCRLRGRCRSCQIELSFFVSLMNAQRSRMVPAFVSDTTERARKNYKSGPYMSCHEFTRQFDSLTQ